jgi:glycosyltransferase involved in cell wall biosynthesis
MKRIIAISNHGQMVGGGEQSFLDLVSHLPISWKVLAAVPQQGELAVRLRNHDIPVRVLALPSLKPTQALSILKALGSHARTYRDVRPHVIYANGSRAALYGGLVGRALRIPVLFHCRITDPDPYLDFFLSRLSNRIIANSGATAKRFNSGLSGKVKVVYNGVNLGWLKEASISKPAMVEDGWKVILVIARVSRLKGHDLALSAFEKVAELEPRAHLICLGSKDPSDPEWWDCVQAKSARSPYVERIHWIGEVDDVRPWLRSSDLVLSASRSESFGRVLVEAMACGVPVVAMRSGGVPEIIRDGQDGFVVKNLNEMTDAVLKVLRDAALRDRLGSSGVERAQSFSLARHVHGMVQVFEESLRQ